uniref:Hypothetical chloroplast RF1 n=1 Tax=Oedogonium cardiacum TaxID=55995 RepID=B3V4N9_OEDCA|nr:hypothetical chloroplast RF1 [Oedogonium cardiacum]ACC97264.1 hypothetical chloroplast RF1 [Oedogonium cardiacum]
MSLATVIKDYIEIIHKIIEISPAYIIQHTNYTDLTTLYFYIINTVKHLFTDIFSLEVFKKIAAFPIIVPNIADSMISEISVLDGTFHNVFTFLDTPLEKVLSPNNDITIIICLEKFFIGLLNSLFLWLPTSAATFLCLRRFVMQGMEIGYIAAIGTMTANIFWLICVLFGIRWIVIPWMSLDILRYWLGFMLLIKYFWDNRLPAKEIKSDFSLNVIKTKIGLNSIITIFTQSFQFHRNFSNPIQQIFLFHFLLALTEQTSLYPFLSHFSLSAQSTYLESFPSNNLMDFILIHSFYLLGIFIGSFSFINFVCWFWEEPAYKVYLWTTKNFQKMRAGDMVRIIHFLFQTLTIALACASLPYFSIEYFITKPLGFLPNDQIFHQSQNAAFLTHSTSPVLYRSPYYFPRQRFFRYDDWAEYYGKNIPLDTSLYDQGAYRLYPIEDLHYGADYEWTRRRSNHVKIRSRMKRIMWFPRNWATQIWDLAKTWSRRNVAWRNEILSQYQNNWDSKSAPFWNQIVREEFLFEKRKAYFQNERKTNSPWAASQNWSQKFLTSGEGFWWNWWAKNTISDNQIWWNWILTKKNQIIIDSTNQFNDKAKNVNDTFYSMYNRDEKNNERMKQNIVFSNYQKLPTSYQLDYWLPQERLISLYSEQSQRQKTQLNFEIATLRKFVRKINKRIQINSTTLKSLSKQTIFSIKKTELYYKKYVFSNSLRSLTNNLKNFIYYNQNSLFNSQDISLIDSNQILNYLFNGYSLNNQLSFFNKWNSILLMQTPNNEINLHLKNQNSLNQIKQNISILSKTNFFNNKSTSLFLTLPAQYYLHKEQSFSRKLQFYGVRTSRQFQPLNNSPIFNFYMKTYFYQYKPTRLYIANTKMKRDLGAGGRNRFKSRQYANKQLKKARILSKTPWIRQWVSQSGFLTRRKRLESWIRYSHYNSNEIWAFIMKADIDNFIKRQPSSHLLTSNEERLLHLRRFLLGEHYETLRWYSYMQHYRSMKTKIGGTKSFANRIYNQQFKGTFHKVRHLFALTPSLSGGGILTFDQPLYNEFANDNQNSIFHKELIHEELLADTKMNINAFLVKDKEKNNLNFNFYSDDLISKSSQIIKNYLLEITPIRQKIITEFLKDKNYVDLTNFLWSGQKTPILLPTTNQISTMQKDFKIDFQQNSMRPSFSIDQQKKFKSILIFMFNRRRSLAKDYKRGSERLWKKWRKNYLIQKQIYKQKNYFAKHDLLSSSFYPNKNNLEINIGMISTDRNSIPLVSINEVKSNFNTTEQTQTFPIYRTTNQMQKTPLYAKNKNTHTLYASSRLQTVIRKALTNSIFIQKSILNKNDFSKDASRKNFGFYFNTKFDNKLEYYNQQKDETNSNIEKVFDVRKSNYRSEVLRSDKIAIKKLINKIYKKTKLFDKIQLKYWTLDYWFKNFPQYKWNILNSNKHQIINKIIIDKNNTLLNIKNKQDELFNILSYIQNRTIRERLEINKKIMTMTNYNQIDSKFFIIRASRHLKRARISQRKKLSQPIQKYKNFFHLETKNIKQINPFKMYQPIDSLKPDLIIKLSKRNSASSSDSLNYSFGLKLRNHKVYDKINNFIESYKIDIGNKNKINSAYVRHSNIFNRFQPFLESLYYLPRLSTLWQSNLINLNMNIKSKIDMGSIYETKQNFTPIGNHKELYRQNFNTKNKIQDNIKRKLLDNHLNRFSERRRWTNQYQTINSEINEQLKKFIERVKQNQNISFDSQKLFNIDPIFLNFKQKTQPMKMNYNNQSNTISKYFQPEFFSLDFQKTIQNFNMKETDQPKFLSLIINQKNKSKLKIYQFSSFQLNYLFNKFKNKTNEHLAVLEINQPNYRIFSNQNNHYFNFISNINNVNSLKIKELIMKEHSELNNKSILNFNKEFFYDLLLNNLIFNAHQEIKKEKINQKNIILTIINQIQTNNSINKINPTHTIERVSSLSKNFEEYLIKNFQQKIEKQLKKLENRLIEFNKLPKEELTNKQNNDVNTESNREFIFLEKNNKRLLTQKKLIAKRIEFLKNFNEKLTAFEIWYLTLPTDWKTNKMKIINNKDSVEGYFDFKKIQKQYYFSKKFVNLLIENCNNFIQYLDFKKEDYLKKQNKILYDLLEHVQLHESSSKNQMKKNLNKLEMNYPIKNTFELTNNFKIQEFLEKPITHIKSNVSNSNNDFKLNKKIIQSQQSETRFPLSVESSIIQLLLKKQKISNFDETLGTLLVIQKRGNVLSQKNIYYKKLKHEWNKNTFSNFSNSVFKRFNTLIFRIVPSSKTEPINGIKNFMAIRNWTRPRPQQQFDDVPVNQKLRQYKDFLIFDSIHSNYLEKKITRQNFLSVDNFIKESILKPQRFEKQQSRKRLKFKKLPRQEHFKNLQVWENSLKQKEDLKNKQFFDDLSQSFQKWKSFGFFPQKYIFQKQILNSATFIPFSTTNYKENNKKYLNFSNFYDNNLQTITNLDIIKQIQYDHLIQKELNFFLNQKSDFNQISIKSLSNKQMLLIGDKDSKPLAFSEAIQNFYLYSEINSEKNKEEINNFDKDIISKIYERFFVRSIGTTIDKSRIYQKNFIGINTFPFYAGWDESLRKFVITNRLLSRRDAGYQTTSNILFKEKEIENTFNIEFTQWPLQGRNAATTFFSHFPFINQPSDFTETIQYRNRTQFQQEEGKTDIESSEIQNKNLVSSNQLLEKNQIFSIKRIKKQKQELRNGNRRNITNLVGPTEIQNRRKAIFYPLKWKSLRSNTKKIILKLPFNKLQNNFADYSNFKKIDQVSYSKDYSFSSPLKEKSRAKLRPLISKFYLLRILRKGNTSKIRLPKLRPYKKYIKKENDILESSWKTFLSKRKLRSYNFVRQKNIRTMHLYKVQLGEKLQWTKMQWLFRKNNSRANRQSDNRKNKSGAHYLRPRKKSLRRRSLGIKYKQHQQIWSFNNFHKNHSNLRIQSDKAYVSQKQKNEISKKTHTIERGSISLTKKMNKYFITDLSNLNLSKSKLNNSKIAKQSKIAFYETPYNWIQPNNYRNLYNNLFQTSSIYTPTLYSILPGHGRFIPKIQTMPLPKSSVQTMKRAIRLANFEPASFIQREVLSYEWSMKQLIQNINNRLNNSVNKLIIKDGNNYFKPNINSNSSFSIDLLIKRHLRLFKKKLIHNPHIQLNVSSNVYLSQFSRQRSFQKRSIRLRKFNMTLAMHLYDRWFFYYYTGGREDPLQNLYQNFEKLTQNISNPTILQNNQSNQSNVLDDSKLTIDNLGNTYNSMNIFKSIRKFLTQKPDQKRSFNTFLTNLKTKKSSKTIEISNEQQNSFNFDNFKKDYSKKENAVSFEPFIDDKQDYSINQWWHILKLFPQTVDGRSAQKEILDKLSSNKTQKKLQEKDLEEDRFYFLKANKSPITQDFQSSQNVNRHYPLNGGLIWPGDYLRLQTIMVPKEKRYNYFYNKNLVSEIKNAAKFNNTNLQTSKLNLDSNSKINEKIQEFQNFILESK